MVTIANTRELAKIQDLRLRAEVLARIRESPLLEAKSSPSGSRFERNKAAINSKLEEARKTLQNKGFTREEIVAATEFLKETRVVRPKTPGSVERKQARLKPFQKKLRDIKAAEDKAKGLVTQAQLQKIKTQESLERTKQTLSEQRQKKLKKKIDPITREQVITSVFEKQGFKVIQRSGKQQIVATKPGKQVIVGKTSIVTALGEQRGDLRFQPVFKEKLGGKNGIKSRAVGKDSRVGISDVRSVLDRKISTQDKSKTKRFFLSAAEVVVTPLRGVGKILFVPNVLKTKPLIEVGQSKIFSTRGKPLIKDPDVQATLLVGGLAGTGLISPVVPKALGVLFTGLSAKAVVDEPTPESFGQLAVIGGLTSVGLGAGKLVPFGLKGKRTQAREVLRDISKDKPPTIKGQEFFKIETLKKDITTTKEVITPEVKVTKPSKLITTQLDITTATPIGSVARSFGGKSQTSSVTIGNKQFTTTKRTFKGKDFFIRSVTEISTGKTTTKVFKGDKLLKTIKTIEKPSILFTEPKPQLSTLETIRTPGTLLELTKSLRTQKGISLLEKGKFDITGKRVITKKSVLKAETIRPKTKTFSKIEVDLRTGKVSLQPKSVEVTKPRIEFVDFPPKQKPFRVTRTQEGVLVTKPSAALSQQATRLRSQFEISFIERVKPKKAPKDKPKEIKKFFTPKEFATELIRRKELAPIVTKNLAKEGVFGRLFFKERPQIIELDIGLSLTKKGVRKERIELVKSIVKNQPSIFIKEPILVLKAIREIPTREKTLTHELLHFKFPGKTEAQILRLEKRTTKFKADNKAKEVLKKLRDERRQETLDSIKAQVEKGKVAIGKLKPKQKKPIEETIQIQRQPQIKILTKELKIFAPKVKVKARSKLVTPLVESVTKQTPVSKVAAITKQGVKPISKTIQEPKVIQQPKVIQDIRTLLEVKTIQQPISIQQPKSIVRQQIVQDVATIQQLRQVQKLALAQRPAAIPKPIQKPLKTPLPKIPKGFLLGLPSPKGKPFKKVPAFKTEVREGIKKSDKFIEVSRQTLPKNKSLNRGARIVEHTTARTFRVKRMGTTNIKDDPTFKLKDQFRGKIGRSRLSSDSIIEKSQFAINTFGERAGIPFNPIRIPRLKEAIARKQAGKIMTIMQKVRTPRDRRKIRRMSKNPVQTGRFRFANPLNQPKKGRVNLVNPLSKDILFINDRTTKPSIKLPSLKSAETITKENELRFL